MCAYATFKCGCDILVFKGGTAQLPLQRQTFNKCNVSHKSSATDGSNVLANGDKTDGIQLPAVGLCGVNFQCRVIKVHAKVVLFYQYQLSPYLESWALLELSQQSSEGKANLHPGQAASPLQGCQFPACPPLFFFFKRTFKGFNPNTSGNRWLF